MRKQNRREGRGLRSKLVAVAAAAAMLAASVATGTAIAGELTADDAASQSSGQVAVAQAQPAADAADAGDAAADASGDAVDVVEPSSDDDVRSADPVAQDDGSAVYAVDVPVGQGDEAGSLGVEVTVPAGALPDGVALVAGAVADADAVSSALTDAGVEYDGLLAVDVRFEDTDGNEVEPSQPVSVRFDTTQGVLGGGVDASSIAVRHLSEDADGAVESVDMVADAGDESDGMVSVDGVASLSADETAESAADATVSAEFTVDSFSSFTITWVKNNYIGKDYTRDVEVSCVDADTKQSLPGGACVSIPDSDDNKLEVVNGQTILFSKESDYAKRYFQISGYTYESAEYRYQLNNSNWTNWSDLTSLQNTKNSYSSGWTTKVNDNELSGSYVTVQVRLCYTENDVPSPDPDPDPEPTPSSDAPAHRKWITKEDADKYTLHLDVTGKVEESYSNTAADVVLVLDTSSSMDDKIGSWGKSTRLDQLKTAANSLVNQLLTAENAQLPEDEQVRVGVISFSDNAHSVNFGQYNDPKYYSSSASNVTNKIDDLDASGNTYWDRALDAVLANNYTGRANASKYVVFVTDGAPSQANNDFDKDIYNNAVVSGKNAVRSGWNVVNVSVDLDLNIYVDPGADALNGQCRWLGWSYVCSPADNNPNWANNQHSAEPDWVNTVEGLTEREKKVASDGQLVEYVSATSGDLNDVFEDIAQTVTSLRSYRINSVSDTLSQWVELVDSKVSVQVGDTEVDSSLYKFTAQGAVVQVEFLNGLVLENGEQLVVSFDIRPSQAAYDRYLKNMATQGTGEKRSPYAVDDEGNVVEGGDGTDESVECGTGGNAPSCISQGVEGFPSNSGAQVTYQRVVDGSPVGKVSIADYGDSPVVTVEAADITVKKVWQPEPADASAVQVELSASKTGEESLTFETALSEDGDWQHAFEAIAVPGWTYTVTETTSIDGYTSEITYGKGGSKPESLSVERDEVWAVQQPELVATVTNKADAFEYGTTAHLPLYKELKGGVLSAGDFTFHLADVTVYDGADEKAQFASGESSKTCDGEDACTVTNLSPGTDQSKAVLGDFGQVTFPGDGVYMFRVYEDTYKPDEGIKYDQHSLYVLYVIKDGVLNRYVQNAAAGQTVAYPSDASEDGWNADVAGWTPAGVVKPDGTTSGSKVDEQLLTWTNVATVSNLPLTGGDATARNVVLAGGGVLLLAGVAWLLAKRRRV